MKVIYEKPPMYDRIVQRFPQAAGKYVVFSWGDRLYSPSSYPLARQILAHEAVHGVRQGANPEAWWEQYLIDDSFRLTEEIAGHREEYKEYKKSTRDRNMLNAYLSSIALRLSGPLYGNIISQNEARKEICSGK